MKEEEKLQRLAEEEKIFNAIISYRGCTRVLEFQITEFYSRGSTLTSWQLETLLICFHGSGPSCIDNILKKVKNAEFTPFFTGIFSYYLGAQQFINFFKRFKETNPDLRYPKRHLLIEAQLVKNQDWDWLYNTTLQQEKWPFILLDCVDAQNSKECGNTFVSLCLYLSKKYTSEIASDEFVPNEKMSEKLLEFYKLLSKITSKKDVLLSVVLPSLNNISKEYPQSSSLFEPILTHIMTDK